MVSRKHLLLGILLLIAIAAAYALYMRGDLTPLREEAIRTSSMDETQNEAFTWSFETNEEGETPKTKVLLTYAGETKEIGMYSGSCSEISAESFEENQVSGVLCWWAGGGDEIGVFKEGEEYVVKVGVQEEPTAETEGFRGDFNTEVLLQ